MILLQIYRITETQVFNADKNRYGIAVAKLLHMSNDYAYDKNMHLVKPGTKHSRTVSDATECMSVYDKLKFIKELAKLNVDLLK